jgi:hypothetical protein
MTLVYRRMSLLERAWRAQWGELLAYGALLRNFGADVWDWFRYRALEQTFARARYFGCSALGRTPDPRYSSPFQPRGVVEPLLWLLHLDRVPRANQPFVLTPHIQE